MKYQQGTNQSYGKSAHYLTERMVLQDNPCRAQYACYENEYTQPAHRIVSEQALKATSPPIMAPAPAMCSLSFHFRLTMTQIIITIREAQIIPVIYQGMFSRCIMSRQTHRK